MGDNVNMLGYDATLAAMKRAGVGDAKALEYARQQWPDVAAEQDAAAIKRADVLEKDEQREVRKLFLALGFDVYWLSQARRTGQTAGVPDLWVMNRERPIAFYWETKRQVGGKLTEAQKQFGDCCRRCGVGYGTGDRFAAQEHLVALGLATRVGNTLEPVR